MAKNDESELTIKSTLETQDNSSKKFNDNTSAVNKNTEALDKNTEARERNAKAKTGSTGQSKISAEVEKIDKQILENKKETQKSSGIIKSKAESIANMNEEQLKVYQYLLQTDRKLANNSTRRLRVSEKNAATAEKESETRAKLAEARIKVAQKEAEYYSARTDFNETRAENYNRKRNPKYQAGRGLYSAGAYLGKNMPSPMGNVTSTLFQLAGTTLSNPAMGVAVGIAQLTKAITELGSASVKAYGEIESIKTQLGVVYGNQTQADNMFGEISQYAIKSPFGIAQTAELATLLKQSGVEATNLMETLKMLGDTAGGNMEKMKRIANNYAQIVSIGKASMLDMRQFAYAGIPIFEKVADELEVSQTALRKLISDGKVTSEVITKVFKDMTSEGGLFFEATSKGAETVKARLQNLADSKQLALGSIGERFLRIGELNGGDAFGFKAIDLAEAMYSKLQEWSSIKNLEKSVKTIENNSSEQARLKTLIQYAKDTGQDKSVIAAFEQQLKELSSTFSPDKQRSIYADLYEMYKGTENISESEDNVISKILELESKYEEERIRNQSSQSQLFEELSLKIGTIDDTEYERQLKTISDNKSYEESIYEKELKIEKEKLNILNKQKEITDDIRMGWLETQVINIQQKSYDNISELKKSSNSALNSFSTIKQLQEQSDSYKKAQEENQIKELTGAITLLKEIAKNTKEGTNIVDFTKVSGEKLRSYITKGAVTARKLATVNSDPNASKDWKLLRDQLSTRYETYKNIAKETDGNSIEREAMRILSPFYKGKVANITNSDDFYTYFNRNYKPMIKQLENKKAEAGSDKIMESYWESIIEDFQNALLEVLAETDIPDVDIEEALKSGNKFQPLWKRIISSATGIPSTAISDVEGSLDFYHENLSTRSMTGSTLSALIKQGMSVDEVQRLTGNRVGMTTPKEGNSVWQIDWKAVRKNMSEFARGLSASTTAIDTWTSGLEAELNTYAELIGNGILSPETNNTKQAMFISSKQAEKMWNNPEDYGINAFGEELKAVLANGNEVVVKEIKDGIALDKNGNKILAESFKIEGKIYDEVKGKIKTVKEETRTARNAQTKNQLLNELITNSINDLLIYNMQRQAGLSSGASKFSSEFSEKAIDLVNNNIELDGSKYKNKEDLYLDYAKNVKEAVDIIDNAIKASLSEINQLKQTDEYKAAKKQADDDAKTKSINSDTSIYNKFGSETRLGTTTFDKFSYHLFDKETMQLAGLSGDNTFGDTGFDRQTVAAEALKNTIKDLNNSFLELGKTMAKDMFMSPFETMGEDLIPLLSGTKTWNDCLTDAGQKIREIAAETLTNMGKYMAEAGFKIAAAGATEKNWGMVALGLGLAATGGFAAGLGNSIKEAQEAEDEKEDDYEKLQSLKNDMVTLLEQARSDALYYEQNLRHKTALGINGSISARSVNDAIIAPNGNVITTAPDDYLIATKTPQNLVNNNSVNVQPKINFSVINNAGVKVSQEQIIDTDGTIQLYAILDDAMDRYIASPKSDGAFTARQARLNGSQTLM